MEAKSMEIKRNKQVKKERIYKAESFYLLYISLNK